MNNAAQLFPKFLVISGVILIASGLAQVFVRPKKPNETPLQKVLNPAVLRAVVFTGVGFLGILVGLGVLPMIHLR